MAGLTGRQASEDLLPMCVASKGHCPRPYLARSNEVQGGFTEQCDIEKTSYGYCGRTPDAITLIHLRTIFAAGRPSRAVLLPHLRIALPPRVGLSQRRPIDAFPLSLIPSRLAPLPWP